MFKFNGSQKGCERLDVGALNSSIFNLLEQNNIKPMYLDYAYHLFENTGYQPVMTFESGKMGFLFINSVKISNYRWNRSTYPAMPNIDEIVLTATDGTAITTTTAVNTTGQFKVPNSENTHMIIGSWRYIEITFSDDNFYYYVRQFKYSGGNGQNPTCSVGDIDSICHVYNIGIRETSTSEFLPINYNYPLSEDVIGIVNDRISNKVIGFSTNCEAWEGERDSSDNLRLWLDARDFNDVWIANELQYINVGFLVDGKMTVGDVSFPFEQAGFIQTAVSVTAHSDGYQFVFMTLELSGYFGYNDRLNLVSKTAELTTVKGFFIAGGTIGAIYQSTTHYREKLGILYPHTGSANFLDSYSVNAILQAKNCVYYNDFANNRIIATNDLEITNVRTPYKISSVANLNSSDDNKIETSRGCFIISCI